MEQVIVENRGAWVKITLNRPDAKNALNTAVLARMAKALEMAGQDPAIRAALVCGAEGNFAAGADIGEIETKTTAEGAVDPRTNVKVGDYANWTTHPNNPMAAE